MGIVYIKLFSILNTRAQTFGPAHVFFVVGLVLDFQLINQAKKGCPQSWTLQNGFKGFQLVVSLKNNQTQGVPSLNTKDRPICELDGLSNHSEKNPIPKCSVFLFVFP